MNDKISIITFTDPMMGLSYESSPAIRKLETHFKGQITFETKMAGLVKNVYDLVDINDLRMYGKKVALNKYKAKLAMIYLQEQQVSNMPIIMNDFNLFDLEHTSSLPLNRAYKTVELLDTTKKDQFLFNLRYSTVVETNPTTHLDELIKVARSTGLDEQKFLEIYKSDASKEAMEKDFGLYKLLNINTLPAYLLQYRGQALLITSLARYEDFIKVIQRLTAYKIKPQHVESTVKNIHRFIEIYPLISSNELISAFDLKDIDELMNKLAPLINNNLITLNKVKQSYFIRKK